ncbi:enoyl-CoA hydratase/isomerase family protein [Polyangium aurulentum]|uniref:enoyl-CoA hydratase/isomerase family protein n=1 Tax=Polyangium aurulentum TaxID=2567896 RepID=UPI0010AE8A07|nr:enoyl-CoA hydratase-related protein [Polyangium aurulentum]UQA55227.1 enoyl-CoA hydratase/isomerase family protein [Polyangium aurulentum]
MTERRYQFIEVGTGDHGALRIALNNPARKNAIGPAMVNELLWALADAAEDPAVRSIVLTGKGDAFCAGGDFAQMTGGAAEAELPSKGDYADLLLAMVRSPKPIVARVNGHAMGGGLGLVAASHFAVASRAGKFGTPEINVGLFPMMIMAVLARVVPRRRLMEMMLFGERMDADQAAALGLVSLAVDAEGLDAAVDRIVQTIASKSPITIKLGLEAFAAQDDLALADALPLLRDRLGQALSTDDAREGLMAFLEKRPPRWTGK